MFVNRDTSHVDTSPLKRYAASNVDCSVVTRDTCHFDKSLLNALV